ncbi:hypothetical protein [Streptomyces sp. TRM49041]|uniref:hypothetical protein n=1 Tax=Streptomyces sp. TRM49041 TaxID=2603216 RepID=UPI0011EF82F6|nr:hypothetical protein [Streptomyces sp. TRM49041]
MQKNDKIPAGPDEDFDRGAAFHEPAAPKRKRVWPRNAALALSAAAVTFLALKLTAAPSDGDTASPATAASASTAASAAPASASAADTSPDTPPVPASPAAGDRPVIPLDEAFPAEVPDGSGGVFTKVGAAVLDSCTEQGAVGPRLAALIAESKGCVGEQIALYKDAQNNQFNVAVFTMKDPVDTFRLVTSLSMAFDDYQVAAQAPPPASGLPVLPSDSGLVQSFTGHGRVMVVGLGQWSDGRAENYQQLVDRLKPLLDEVSQSVGRHETAN